MQSYLQYIGDITQGTEPVSFISIFYEDPVSCISRLIQFLKILKIFDIFNLIFNLKKM